MILWLIEQARALGLPHVYLGYWVQKSRKMAYKARFKPSEILIGGVWRDAVPEDNEASADLTPEDMPLSLR